MEKEEVVGPEEENRNEKSAEDEKARWWVIRVKGGKEDLVKAELEKLMREDPRIKEVFIPEEEERYKKKTKEGEKEYVRKKKLISGYVYAKMELDENLWNRIRSIPNVSMLLGERGIPIPVSSEKIESLKSKAVSGEISQIFSVSIGDRVRIKSGPLKGFSGVVESISEDRNKVRVLITIFGRQTPVEIEANQIEKET